MTTETDTSFLIDPPAPGEVTAILALDVDGMLNSHELPQAESGGGPFGIDSVDATVLDVLDRALASPGVTLAWATTWGADVAKLRHLLADGFVPAERPAGEYVDIDWKEKAVTGLVRRYGARVARVDDGTVPNSIRWGSLPAESAGDQALLMAPQPEAGLSPADSERVAAFLVDGGTKA